MSRWKEAIERYKKTLSPEMLKVLEDAKQVRDAPVDPEIREKWSKIFDQMLHSQWFEDTLERLIYGPGGEFGIMPIRFPEHMLCKALVVRQCSAVVPYKGK